MISALLRYGIKHDMQGPHHLSGQANQALELTLPSTPSMPLVLSSAFMIKTTTLCQNSIWTHLTTRQVQLLGILNIQVILTKTTAHTQSIITIIKIIPNHNL